MVLDMVIPMEVVAAIAIPMVGHRRLKLVRIVLNLKQNIKSIKISMSEQQQSMFLVILYRVLVYL